MAEPPALMMDKVLGADCFAGTGKPTGLYWHPTERLFAIASTFRPVAWTGRILHPRLRHRVAIYKAQTCERVAIFDAIHWPINDVAFHPNHPLVAIATGAYDGGFFFEGDLLVWNYHTGHHYSPNREQNSEATRCRFSGDGQHLYWLARPYAEEDADGNDISNEIYAFRTALAPDAVVEPIPLTEAGFTTPHAPQHTDATVPQLKQLATAAGHTYEPRWHKWDLAWSGSDEIIAAGNTPLLERWSCSGQRIASVDQHGGVGVELFWSSHQAMALINEFRPKPGRGLVFARSSLLRYSSGTGELTSIIPDCPVFSMSFAASGYGLARNVDAGRDPSHLISPSLQLQRALDLGYYDWINNQLKIDGAEDLFFIQGTPPSSSKQKSVCQFDPITGQVTRLFPLEWDHRRGAHLHSDGGCYLADADDPGLVLAGRVYSPRGFPKDGAFICRRRLSNGAALWSRSFNSPVTAIAYVREAGVVAFTLSEGKIGLLDASTGDLVGLQEMMVDGASTVGMCLAISGERLAVGTVDGMIILYRVVSAAAQ